jgi:hypothetical protein
MTTDRHDSSTELLEPRADGRDRWDRPGSDENHHWDRPAVDLDLEQRLAVDRDPDSPFDHAAAF